MSDIDIDFLDREVPLAHLTHVHASNVVGDKVQRHATGIYVQDIPVDPFTGWASLTYDEAEAAGYFKLDFCTNTVYEGVRDEAHLLDLMAREPPWEFLQERSILARLAQNLDKHFHVLRRIKPCSIEDLAIVLAIIRPAKAHLLSEDRSVINQKIWLPPQNDDERYWLKKSHAVAYAVSLVVQLNLLVEQTAQAL